MGTLCFIILKDTCFEYLLKLPHRGDSNKFPKHMFCGEIRTIQDLSYISFCSVRILYNSKFILMATSLGTNAMIVAKVHCIRMVKFSFSFIVIFISSDRLQGRYPALPGPSLFTLKNVHASSSLDMTPLG